MSETSVFELHAAGFPIGPPADEQHICGHLWGDHILHAEFGSPIEGGRWSCPWCDCTGTWSVNDPPPVCGFGRQVKAGPDGEYAPCFDAGVVRTRIQDTGGDWDLFLCEPHYEHVFGAVHNEAGRPPGDEGPTRSGSDQD